MADEFDTTRLALTPTAEQALEELERKAGTQKLARSLVKGIRTKFDLIRANWQYGEAIPRRLFPRRYILEHRITNLRRVELPQFWRLLYTRQFTPNPGAIQIHILDILPHPEYDTIFGYKRK